MSTVTQAEIELRLEEIVDWAAAKIAAMSSPETPAGSAVTAK